MTIRNLIVLAGIVAVMFAGQAQAGILADAGNTFAYNDGATLFKGTRAYSGALIGQTLDADLDFAVFAPGQFQAFLNANSITGAGYTDPSPANEYVYAYQVLDSSSSPGVEILSIGLDGDEPFTIANTNQVPLSAFTVNPPTVVASTLDALPPGDTSARWEFTPGVLTGATSTILFYSSPAPPEGDRGTLRSGIVSQDMGPNDGTDPAQLSPPLSNEWVPSPQVPEPGTLVLLGAGAATILIRRRIA